MTELIPVAREESGQMSVYDRVIDPIAFIKEMGQIFAQSGAGGAKSPAEGQLLALVCMCEKTHPFEISRRFHLMDGKLSKKADVMLADLRAAGGSFKWIADGKDGQSASIELEFKGQSYKSTYTMADAERAKLVKAGGGWEKNPANMLRARAISEGMRMIAPEIAAGVYTPEEVESFDETPVASTASKPRRTKQEQEARREELQSSAVIDSNISGNPAVTAPAPTPAVTTAPPPTQVTQQPSPQAAAAPAVQAEPVIDQKQEKISELLAVVKQVYPQMDRAAFEAAMKAANPTFAGLDNMSCADIEKLRSDIANRANAAKK